MTQIRASAALSLLLALCLGAAPVPALAAEETTLTLEKSIELAFQNNSNYRTIRLALEKQGAGLVEARGRTSPSVTLSATGASDRFKEGLGTEFVVSVAQTADGFHPLLNNGSYPLPLTSVDLAALSEQQAKLRLEKAKADLVYSVTQAYIAVLKARSLVEVETEGVKVAEAAREDAKLKLSAGVGTNLDVLRADLEVANAENALAKARNAVSLSEADFFATLGVKPPAEPVALAEPPDVARPSGSVQDLTEQALKVR
ncbi:MAG: TolC family protein, partial [Chitinophagales bacterium]